MRGNIPSVVSLLCNNCRKIDIHLYIPFRTPARTFVTFSGILLAVFEMLMQRYLYDKCKKRNIFHLYKNKFNLSYLFQRSF